MNIPEELVPVVEWWEKDGKQTVAILAVAGIAVAGWYGWKGWSESREARASEALLTAAQAEDLESAVANYGGTKAGPALRMRLAKRYFDSERYEEALAEYEKLDGSAPEGFDDVPSVGRAECLEALGRTEEALKSYDAFAEAKPKSFLALTAKIGAARCVAQLGDKTKALERLAAAKAELAGDDTSKALVESAEALVKRWEKRERKTLFDAADAAAKQAEETVAAAAEIPAEVPAEIPAAKPETPAVPETPATPEAPAAAPAAIPDPQPAK